MYKTFVDGFCEPNPGVMAIGGYILDPEGKEIYNFSQRLGEGTNNTAEYFAIIFTIKKALELGIKRLEINTDSKISVMQILHQWKIKKAHLELLAKSVWEDLAKFDEIQINWIPREQNEKADFLAEKAAK